MPTSGSYEHSYLRFVTRMHWAMQPMCAVEVAFAYDFLMRSSGVVIVDSASISDSVMMGI